MASLRDFIVPKIALEGCQTHFGSSNVLVMVWQNYVTSLFKEKMALVLAISPANIATCKKVKYWMEWVNGEKRGHRLIHYSCWIEILFITLINNQAEQVLWMIQVYETNEYCKTVGHKSNQIIGRCLNQMPKSQ